MKKEEGREEMGIPKIKKGTRRNVVEKTDIRERREIEREREEKEREREKRE